MEGRGRKNHRGGREKESPSDSIGTIEGNKGASQ